MLLCESWKAHISNQQATLAAWSVTLHSKEGPKILKSPPAVILKYWAAQK